MGQYKVPQDVEAEDKILGPLTIKQFIYAIIGFAWGAVCFFIFRPIPDIGIPLMLVVGVPVAMLFMLLAFYRRDGQNFEQFLIALVGFFSQARRRIWRKEEIVESFRVTPRAVVEEVSQRNPAEVRSQLERLGTMIDARGWNAPQAVGVGQLTMPHDDRLVMPALVTPAEPVSDPLPATVAPMDAFTQGPSLAAATAAPAADPTSFEPPRSDAAAPLSASATPSTIVTASGEVVMQAATPVATSEQLPAAQPQPSVASPRPELSFAAPEPPAQLTTTEPTLQLQPAAIPDAPVAPAELRPAPVPAVAVGAGFVASTPQPVAAPTAIEQAAAVPLVATPMSSAPTASTWDLGPTPHLTAVSAEEARQPDMLDITQSPLAQNLGELIQDAANDVREEALEQMQQAATQPLTPAPTAASTPVAPAQPHGPFVVPGLSTSVTKPVPAPILTLATERDDLTVSQIAATAGRSVPLAEGATVELRNHA